MFDTSTSKLRYSNQRTAKPINFYCRAPGAHEVHLAGDFNNWNPHSLPMHRQVDGVWLLQVMVAHGHHQYRFLVDGKPTLDPGATGKALNEQHEEVSIMAVS